MKIITIQTIAVLLLINIAFAVSSSEESGSSAVGVSQPIKRNVPPDLSTYPDMFIKNGVFDAVIVVGDKAPASDVIAQSNLIQFFVGYLGKTLVGSAKLASEIDALGQNIISIGSPCHNPVSAQIMIDPKPCDKWMEPGKAFIMLYYYKGYTHMVIEGYSDKGTREAVNALINYKKGSLKGGNMLIEVNESKTEINNFGIEEKAAEKEEEKDGSHTRYLILALQLKKIEAKENQKKKGLRCDKARRGGCDKENRNQKYGQWKKPQGWKE